MSKHVAERERTRVDVRIAVTDPAVVSALDRLIESQERSTGVRWSRAQATLSALRVWARDTEAGA